MDENTGLSMKPPSVTVIVPNYNHAPYLRQRLDSILAQSFQDFELILLDDCSSDDSLAILKEYAQKRPDTKLIVNEKNSGSPFAQWNKGAQIAQGSFLWIAESDDLAHTELLARNVAALLANPKAVMAYCQSVFINEKGEGGNNYRENYQYIYKTDRWENDFYSEGIEECRSYMLRHNSIPNASAVLFRKQEFLEAGPLPVDWKLNGDWMFYCKLLQKGGLAFSAETLNYFRKHEQTQRQRANADATAYFEILQLADFISEKNAPDAEFQKYCYTQFAHWWIGSLFRQDMAWKYWRDNYKLYKRFRAYRDFLLLRIGYTALYLVLIHIIEILRIKELVKKWRHRLFPGKYFEH